MQTLIFYSKPGCHLCEGLQEKLGQITNLNFKLEVRDIMTNPKWFELYQYEIPVLCLVMNGTEKALPRFSPRTSAAKIRQKLATYFKDV